MFSSLINIKESWSVYLCEAVTWHTSSCPASLSEACEGSACLAATLFLFWIQDHVEMRKVTTSRCCLVFLLHRASFSLQCFFLFKGYWDLGDRVTKTGASWLTQPMALGEMKASDRCQLSQWVESMLCAQILDSRVPWVGQHRSMSSCNVTMEFPESQEITVLAEINSLIFFRMQMTNIVE